MVVLYLVGSMLLLMASCHRYSNEMVYLDYYTGYSAYEDPASYLKQLDVVVQNITSLTKRLNADIDRELEEASNYDLKSTTDSINLNGAEIINKMLARQFIVDLLIYQISYCEQMFNAASIKFRKSSGLNPLFDDFTFEQPVQRVVIYEWVRQMVKTFNEACRIGDKLSDKWRAVRESINNNIMTTDVTK